VLILGCFALGRQGSMAFNFTDYVYKTNILYRLYLGDASNLLDIFYGLAREASDTRVFIDTICKLIIIADYGGDNI
jgi:hypothetical protein